MKERSDGEELYCPTVQIPEIFPEIFPEIVCVSKSIKFPEMK